MSDTLNDRREPSPNEGPDARALRVSAHASRAFETLRAEIFSLCNEACRDSEEKGRRDAALELHRAGFTDAAAFLMGNAANGAMRS
ncbi:hypothetical protein ACD578_05245 [Microvirga sp. RSM25]|uniref:hypothetical protein n=1 Tax=Microvirga sp. RSM25 TaxID=3273802 RepID=UPI00384E7932